MDEKAAVRAIASAIDANADTFLNGIIQNGHQKTMEKAHKTVLGTITGYYTCKIHCMNVRLRFMPGVSNLNHGTAPRFTYYDIEIYVAEAALMEQGEEDAYITAHENFRVLVSRMAKYFLKDAEIFTDETASKSFRMPSENRIVDVENLNPLEQKGIPILGSIIKFSIVGCND